MYFVYVLKSLKDGHYYFGQTNDVERRLSEHNSGNVSSTKPRSPLVLIGYKTFKTRRDARWCEYQIKHHGDKKKKLIKEIERNVVGNRDWRASGQS